MTPEPSPDPAALESGPAASLDQLIALWAIQDSLLQAYRGIFITTESILFGIAVVVATGPQPLWMLAILAVLGLGLIWIWHQVCRNRALAVTWCQRQCLRHEAGEAIHQPVTRFKQWQDAPVLDPAAQRLGRSSTRWLLDVVLPASYVVAWVAVAVGLVLPRLWGAV